MQEPGIGFNELAAIVVITLFVSLVILFLWNRITAGRATGAVMREEAYRQLAQQATAALAQATADQKRIAAGMDELRTRMAAIEALLREVG